MMLDGMFSKIIIVLTLISVVKSCLSDGLEPAFDPGYSQLKLMINC